MSHINYTATISTMGDATDEYADRYVAALEKGFKEAFQNAVITVERDDRISSSQVQVSDDLDANEVEQVANIIWNDQDF